MSLNLSDYTNLNILQIDILHKLLQNNVSVERIKNFGIHYLVFLYYENKYNTNLNLRNHFTSTEAKQSFQGLEKFTWKNRDGQLISNNYEQDVQIGDTLEIYDGNNEKIYQSKIFTETQTYDAKYPLYHTSGYLYNENIHFLVQQFNKYPKKFGTNGKYKIFGSIESWDTSSVTNFAGLFQNKRVRRHYNLQNWDLSKGITFDFMFADSKFDK